MTSPAFTDSVTLGTFIIGIPLSAVAIEQMRDRRERRNVARLAREQKEMIEEIKRQVQPRKGNRTMSEESEEKLLTMQMINRNVIRLAVILARHMMHSNGNWEKLNLKPEEIPDLSVFEDND